MTRARILADYVSSGDELALKAPLISPALVTPNLGTPSAGTMTNVTGIPAAQVGGVLPVGVTGGSGLTALGTVTSANLSNTAIVYPTGHVIQTIEINNTTVGSATTSDTLVRDTGLTGTIENVLASSYVLIFSQCNFQTGAGASAQLNCSFGLFRETTEIMAASNIAFYVNPVSGSNVYGNFPAYWSHLDTSPATGTNNYYQGIKTVGAYSSYIYSSYRSLIMMEIAQ